MSDQSDSESVVAVVLDYLAHGNASDGRQHFSESAVVYAVGKPEFGLYECSLEDDSEITIGDRVPIDPPAARAPGLDSVTETTYDGLSGGAQSELDYAVEEVVEAETARFIGFFNDAQPISLRQHQLNLLPGIGSKLRDTILDERKRSPFESFEDLESRVDGLHDPNSVVVERILEEIRDTDVKYHIFATANQ